ncbi:MAG: DEAD/DEAH box helicase [Rhizobiaceae bacterium]
MCEPKPIQVQAIPPHLAGRDILGIAQTGSGKTAAFSLPILSKIIALGTKRHPKTARALILAPTRELAVQIEDSIRKLSRGAHVSTALVLGGVSRKAQVNRIRPGIDVMIATPGRLTDLIKTRDVDLSETRWLVLDEADRMLDMGFVRDVRRIIARVHCDCQTALFSATMPREVVSLAEQQLKDPVRIEIAQQGTTASEIEQSVVMARTRQKRQVLSNMLENDSMRSVIVFSRTKHGADRITRDLKRDGHEAAVIHGNKSQNARQAALNGFRNGRVRILVATDIAARGIDVPGISHVVNFDLPDEAESYVHRIGRTGRNGEDGIAVTLCDPKENAKLRSVERVIRMRLPVTADHLGEPDPVRDTQKKSSVRADNDSGRPKGQRQPRKRHRKGCRTGNMDRSSGGEAKWEKTDSEQKTDYDRAAKAKFRKRRAKRRHVGRSPARAA